MKITGFEVRVVEIPMRVAVQHALAERNVARNVLVRAVDDEGREGWGESCPREYVTGETLESVQADLLETILPGLVGIELSSFEEASALLLARLDTLRRNQHAAFCAAELAVLDLLGHALERSCGEVVGPVAADPVVYSGVVASTSAKGAAHYAQGLEQHGLSIIKVKLVESLELNRELLQVVRDILGDEARLRVDANAAWSAAEAMRQLEALADFQLEGVEQPLAADDRQGHIELTAAGLVPVVVDETLVSLEDAQRLVGDRGCDVFNLRISKNGGLCNAARLHRLATEAGLRCQLGAQVGETSLLSAAGRQLATRCGDLLWLEGSFGELLLEEDPFEPTIAFGAGGRAPALTTPGLGTRPESARVEALTISHHTLTPKP